MIAAMVFLAISFTPALAAQNTTAATPASSALAPQPAAQIDLSPLGYQGLPEMARLASQDNVSVDFVDRSHVLITFNPKKLFVRLPECPPTHHDRVVHAAILEVPSGKIVKEADWYLHDGQRYLWALGSGRFLLRKLNTLYLVDSDLKETKLMTSPREFLWLTVTPDGKQIIAETEDESPTRKPSSETGKSLHHVKIDFIDVNTLAVQRTIKSDALVTIEGTSTGFADVSHNLTGKVWLVRFGPSSKQRANIARVRSRCIPDVFYSSVNTMLIGRCSTSGPDYSVSAFTITGHRLWHQRWTEPRYVPKIAHSEDGTRFAVSTLMRQVMTPSQSGDEEDDEADANHGLLQSIQVFDTANGTSVSSVNVTPVVLSAQNYSLSPDGERLAVLAESSLKLYDLPPLSEDDRARSNAVKADVPGLYMEASATEVQVTSGTAENDPGFGAAEAAPEPAPSEAVQKEAVQKEAVQKQAVHKEAVQPESAQPARADAMLASEAHPAAPADAEGSLGDSSITFRVSSRIVVVDVVVTDRAGKPVKGLGAADFNVAEDGKDQRLANFEESSAEDNPSSAASSARPTSPPEAAVKLPPNVFTNNSKAAETHSVTLILLDLLNTPVADQAYAREQLIKFLRNRSVDRPVALCTLSNNLRLIQGFTQEENLLIAAVNGKKGGVKANPWQGDTGMSREIQFQKDLSLLNSNAQFTVHLLEQQQDEQTAHDTDMRMRYTLDAFAQLARYLSGIPGRKNVIWLSGSFPIGIAPNPNLSQLQGVIRNYTFDMKKTANLLAEAHVAVYPVNAKGVVTQPMFSASNNGEYQPPQVAGSLTPSPGAAGNPALANTSASLPMSSRFDDESRQIRESTAGEQASMEQVASDTGGKAFLGGNGIEEAIETAVEQGSHYYSISYTPSNKRYDGGFRKIKVSLDRKGYRLAYRQGYYAVDPNAPLKDGSDPAGRIGVAAMQQGSPQSRQIVFAARVVPLGKPRKVNPAMLASATFAKKRKGQTGPVEMQHYGIDFAVDPAHLLFTPSATGRYHGLLDFMVTAFNDDGRLVASQTSTAASDLKPANYKDVMTGGFRLHQELDVPTDAVSLRLGVEDGTSNRIGTLEVVLPVPAPPEVSRTAVHALPEIEPD